MAERNLGQPLNFNKNEIRNAVAQNLGADPGSPIAGQFWYRTDLEVWRLRLSGSTVSLSTGGGGLANAYSTITDGTTPASAAGGDTFKLRTGNAHLTLVTQSNDGTHGDNALFTVVALTARAANESKLVATDAADGKISATFLTGKLAMADLTDGTTTGTGSVVRQSYVDNLSQGVDWKASVRAATTAAITLSAPQTVDGVSVIAGDRVLVKNQASALTNGIYAVAAGAWTRTTDFDASADVTGGAATFVNEGTVNANTGWILTTDDAIVLDTTALVFSQFMGTGTVTGANVGGAGIGLYDGVTGNVINIRKVNSTTTAITVALNSQQVDFTFNPANVNVDTLGAGSGLSIAKGGTGGVTAAAARTALSIGTKYTALIGDNSATTFTITRATHLGSADRANFVQTLDEASGEYRTDSIQVASNGDVTIGINPAPATNSVRVIIYG